MGSLELIFKKAKRALSVSRKASESTGPRRVKVSQELYCVYVVIHTWYICCFQGIYNNSTTSTKSTDEVLHEIESVLKQLGISYEKDK